MDAGRSFSTAPPVPIPLDIREGEEESDLLPYFETPPIASDRFVEALHEAGVDNIDTYDVVLKSRASGEILFDGYKAINIIGLAQAADAEAKNSNGSGIVDSTIQKLKIDVSAGQKMRMFRLAEKTSVVIVGETVKNHLESKGFTSLRFTEAEGAFIL